jgi:vitamin B12 transporter
MIRLKRPSGYALAVMLGVAWFSNLACAQDQTALPEITVTADRVDEPVNSTGSDATVIPGSQIQQWSAQGITEVLREVVGVTVTQTGGPSSLTEVRLRGADPGQALVMIDGVPIGNVAGTDGSLDFGNLTALDIDRIEIVRGPQSSLYGSDAMSGVINIITKKGVKGKPVRTATVEGGSYGTIQGRASVSGLDLFTRRLRHAYEWISAIRVPGQWPADHRRRRHAVAAPAEQCAFGQGRRRRPLHLHRLADCKR